MTGISVQNQNPGLTGSVLTGAIKNVQFRKPTLKSCPRFRHFLLFDPFCFRTSAEPPSGAGQVPFGPVRPELWPRLRNVRYLRKLSAPFDPRPPRTLLEVKTKSLRGTMTRQISFCSRTKTRTGPIQWFDVFLCLPGFVLVLKDKHRQINALCAQIFKVLDVLVTDQKGPERCGSELFK